MIQETDSVMAERASSTAEYMKIRRYVMTLILRAGKQSVRIPTVTELARKFGVSRPTVSKAMKVLTDDGFIIARPSLGSFTNPARSALQGSDMLPIIGILENDGPDNPSNTVASPELLSPP